MSMRLRVRRSPFIYLRSSNANTQRCTWACIALQIQVVIRLTAITTRLKPSVQAVKADHRLLMTPASDAPDCPLSQRAVAPERAAAQEPPDSFQPWLALQPPACARLTLRSAVCDRLLSLPAR